MEFNTSTLGYNLCSGKLKLNRKHSEQLNKFLAGFIDSDGCFYIYWGKDRFDQYRVYLMLDITQSECVDKDFELMKSLQMYYNVGKLSFYLKEGLSYCSWRISSRETKVLLNRIQKHIRVKGTHLDNLLWLEKELSGFLINKDQVEDIKPFIKCSRSNSRWLKHPKHPSWAWLAGYLAGDGHFRLRLNRKYFDKRVQSFRFKNELVVSATTQENDSFILEFIKTHLGGHVLYSGLYPRWTMGLGKQSGVVALKILKKLRKYMCLRSKYTIIENMITFHEENKSQRLNELAAKAEATVQVV